MGSWDLNPNMNPDEKDAVWSSSRSSPELHHQLHSFGAFHWFYRLKSIRSQGEQHIFNNCYIIPSLQKLNRVKTDRTTSSDTDSLCVCDNQGIWYSHSIQLALQEQAVLPIFLIVNLLLVFWYKNWFSTLMSIWRKAKQRSSINSNSDNWACQWYHESAYFSTCYYLFWRVFSLFQNYMRKCLL